MTGETFRVAVRDALREATPFVLDHDIVRNHHFAAFGRDLTVREEPTTAERQFLRAATHGLAAIGRADRHPLLNPTTGHVAESITETLLVQSGWTIVDQQTGDVSTGHGIDLAALTPDMEHLFVVEVKGSVSAARWPQLSRRELAQFSPAWLDKPGQPGMDSLGVNAADVYGLVVTIQFGLGRWKSAATADFTSADPILRLDQLDDMRWLTEGTDTR
jgi:hypothetical protein